MRPLAHLADRDDAIAFAAFHAFITPALRAAARAPLHRARHAGRACHGPAGTDWCADCEESLDELKLTIFDGLRAVLAGRPRTTRSGEPVRELTVLSAHLTSTQAGDQDAAVFAQALCGSTGTATTQIEPAWLRAARAQLVHYPLRHLEERTRRADAVARGAAARPDRDLRQAAWAAPLRCDPVDLDLLILAVFRVRRGGTDLLDIPDDLRERHGLGRAEAARRMSGALIRLRATNRVFYMANIGADQLSEPSAGPGGDPHEHLAAVIDREAARSVLIRLLTTPATVPGTGARTSRRDAYRTVVAEVCAAGAHDEPDPIGVAARLLHLSQRRARRLVRRLALLIAAAGLDWAVQLARSPITDARSARPIHERVPQAPRRPQG